MTVSFEALVEQHTAPENVLLDSGKLQRVFFCIFLHLIDKMINLD